MSPGMAGRLKQVSDVLDTGRPLTLGDVDGFARAVGKGNIPKSTDAVIGAKVGDALTSLAPAEFKAARLAQGSLSDAQMLTKGLDASKWYKGANAADTIAEAVIGTRPDARTIFSDAGEDAMKSLAKLAPAQGARCWTPSSRLRSTEALGLRLEHSAAARSATRPWEPLSVSPDWGLAGSAVGWRGCGPTPRRGVR